jgi:hypothetical protein
VGLVTSFICTEARYPSRRYILEESETWPYFGGAGAFKAVVAPIALAASGLGVASGVDTPL